MAVAGRTQTSFLDGGFSAWTSWRSRPRVRSYHRPRCPNMRLLRCTPARPPPYRYVEPAGSIRGGISQGFRGLGVRFGVGRLDDAVGFEVPDEPGGMVITV